MEITHAHRVAVIVIMVREGRKEANKGAKTAEKVVNMGEGHDIDKKLRTRLPPYFPTKCVSCKDSLPTNLLRNA